MSYLHPIRMYVFTSAFFFIIFFSLFNAKNLHIHDNTKKAQKQAEIGMQEALKGARTKEDSLAIENALGGIKNMNLQPKIHKDSDDNEGGIGFSLDSASRVDRSVSSYDSAQDALPPAQRDSWLKRLAKRKTIDLNVRYKDNSKGLMEEFMNVLNYYLSHCRFLHCCSSCCISAGESNFIMRIMESLPFTYISILSFPSCLFSPLMPYQILRDGNGFGYSI